jgi:hypothetical protein
MNQIIEVGRLVKKPAIARAIAEEISTVIRETLFTLPFTNEEREYLAKGRDASWVERMAREGYVSYVEQEGIIACAAGEIQKDEGHLHGL